MPWWDARVSDAERDEMKRNMLEERPDADLENLLMGELDAPASPDRPDLPVWDYLSFTESHPEVALSDLTSVRFPVLYFEGESSVTSVDEEMKPLPRSYKGRVPESLYVIDAVAIVRRYAMEHEAGLQVWDHEARGIVRLQPLAAWRDVLQAWTETLQRTAAS
ncbi:hypothetical protein GCM10025783_32330 [Amnibacterium soli]|uniref:SseB protein N-terminal domain-containing protein n=1 Tax=Amnibacterium soli TaxID=1282736 RepID=A0ABP8ZHN1_9MICO